MSDGKEVTEGREGQKSSKSKGKTKSCGFWKLEVRDWRFEEGVNTEIAEAGAQSSQRRSGEWRLGLEVADSEKKRGIKPEIKEVGAQRTQRGRHRHLISHVTPSRRLQSNHAPTIRRILPASGTSPVTRDDALHAAAPAPPDSKLGEVKL